MEIIEFINVGFDWLKAACFYNFSMGNVSSFYGI